jgi:hypothetical protein
MSANTDRVLAWEKVLRSYAAAFGVTVEESDAQPLVYDDYVREGVRMVRLALHRCATWPLALIGWLGMRRKP